MEQVLESLAVGALAGLVGFGVRAGWYAWRGRGINRAKKLHPAYSNQPVEPRALRRPEPDPAFTTPQQVFTEEMLDRVTIRPVVRGSLPPSRAIRPDLILPPPPAARKRP